jgi:hypothetical protein
VYTKYCKSEDALYNSELEYKRNRAMDIRDIVQNYLKVNEKRNATAHQIADL